MIEAYMAFRILKIKIDFRGYFFLQTKGKQIKYCKTFCNV